MSWELEQDRKAKLINIKHLISGLDTVYIGRGSIWGNPWVVKKGDAKSRARAISNYRNWLLGTAHTDLLQVERNAILRSLHHLEGKTLVCYCKPLACHGDVLLDLLDEHLSNKI